MTFAALYPHDDAPHLTRALAASGVGLWSWDIARDVVVWDEQMERIVGARPTKASEYAALVAPDDRERVWTSVQRAVASGVYADQEYRFVRPSGEVRWVMCKGQVECGPDGRPARVLGATVDITERRAHHEQLLTLHRLESVGLLAGGIAHDFNNMLAVILGCANLAEAKLPEAGGPAFQAVRGDLAELREAAVRAASLTSQLLAFAGKQAHEPRAFDVNASVAKARQALGALVPPEVEVVLDLRATRHVHADPRLIERVFTNLLIQARDSMPGGGRVVVATRDLAPGGPHGVRVDVSDTGPGIPTEHLARIFEPFFAPHATGPGGGLGLATCFGIVEQSGGTLTVTSVPGRGTTFHVDLEACAPRSVTATAPMPPLAAPRRGSGPTSVLVVEDEAIVRKMSVRSLELHGFQVHAAASGAEALAILRTTPIDLVVSDIMMPQMTGRQLAERIRETWATIPILLMTGYSEEPVGGFELLPKPFTPAALAERVQSLLAMDTRSAAG